MRAAASLSLVLALPLAAQTPLRWLDLADDASRQVTVDRDPGQYLGHPTTLLLPDGRTMLCVYPKGHGRGAIVYKRSDDGGLTWSERLPTPASWQTSKETPTIHRLIDPDSGAARVVLFSGLFPIRSSVSEDDGETWSELVPIGPEGAPYGGIVAMGDVARLANGDYAAWFHDDGRFFVEGGDRSQFTVYQTLSHDGGLTWDQARPIWTGEHLDLCEPGVVRSPDGATLAMLLRENSRRGEAHVMFSSDEAATWSAPRPLPRVLTGDRHVLRYAPDGRLFVSFRDMAKASPTRGDWVAWVGTFDDLLHGREGQYRVRLSRNWRGTDCGYPGVEVLPDGTIVATTYGHWAPGARPWIRSVRLTLAELDELANGPCAVFTREPGTVHPVDRVKDWWPQRVAEDLELARQGGFELVMLGDSITQSWNAEGAKVWQEFWQPRKAINVGVSGDRTQHVLWRLDHGLLDALAGEANDVRCVVLMIGTNNSNGDDCTSAEIGRGVVAVVRRLRAQLPHAKVLLLSIFPREPKPCAQRVKNAEASAFAAAAFAGDDMVLHLDIGDRFVEADGSITKQTMRDYLHLTEAGYRIWAEAIVADVDAALR